MAARAVRVVSPPMVSSSECVKEWGEGVMSKRRGTQYCDELRGTCVVGVLFARLRHPA